MTLADLVDEVEFIADESESALLQQAVDAYREEERENRFQYGMRGDMEPAEDAFLDALRTRFYPSR